MSVTFEPIKLLKVTEITVIILKFIYIWWSYYLIDSRNFPIYRKATDFTLFDLLLT